ncbi:MAG: hypothetical protein IJR26_08515 [Bacteroidales bacterium]|nr:hypothetical protein [Bacteroidales bacterium]
MIIRSFHKEASEMGANSNGVRKEALRVAFYLNNSTFAGSMLVIMSVALRQKSRKSFQIFQYLSV